MTSWWLPWVIQIHHVLGDHLAGDGAAERVGEQADHVLLDLKLCNIRCVNRGAHDIAAQSAQAAVTKIITN